MNFSVRCDTKVELDEKIKTNFWNGIKTLYPLKTKIDNRINLEPEEINDYFFNISMPATPQQNTQPIINPSTNNVENS